jgi:hypothetical protein
LVHARCRRARGRAPELEAAHGAPARSRRRGPRRAGARGGGERLRLAASLQETFSPLPRPGA